MPELPELEIAARNLRRWTDGRAVRAVAAATGAARIFRPGGARALDALVGARFREVRRWGKNLLVTLAFRRAPVGFWSHLGMTGKWLRRRAGDEPPRYSRLAIDLDDRRTRLHYCDPRLFGRFRLVPGAHFDLVPELKGLGPDPLTDGIDARRLEDRLARIRGPIKVALLDQGLLAGVGNIQASESLFRARIDPRRPARSLSRAEVLRLASGIRASIAFTLARFDAAGADRGDGDITYVEEDARQNPFLVYGRAGERCPAGKGKHGSRGQIARIVQAQRSTFFCPACQH